MCGVIEGVHIKFIISVISGINAIGAVGHIGNGDACLAVNQAGCIVEFVIHIYYEFAFSGLRQFKAECD